MTFQPNRSKNMQPLQWLAEVEQNRLLDPPGQIDSVLLFTEMKLCDILIHGQFLCTIQRRLSRWGVV